MSQTAPAATTPAPGAAPAWHVLAVSEVMAAQGVDPVGGLPTQEAQRRLERVGPNQFAEAPHEPRWRAFVRQYRDLMQIVLLVAGILSILPPLEQYGTGIFLVVLTLFNATLGLRQEGKAAAAIDALSKMMIVQAKVRRSGELLEIPAQQIVPGDLVSVEAGDVIPADGRIVEAATLEIDESALTGESLPVAKGVEAVPGADTPLGDRTDMAYMNTAVTRGSGTLVVTATGMTTEVGHISGMLEGQDQVKTPLTRQLETLTRQILSIAGLALVASMVINLARGLTFKEVFTASIAFAIAAIPTGLPAVVTAILSKGTQVLAAAGAIMKQLRSTETLGSTSAINSDKTGTLTLNQMTAVQLSLPERRYAVSGTGYGTEGRINRVAGESEIDLDAHLLPMVLASDAVVRNGELIGDPTEGALVVLAAKGGIDAETTRLAYPRVAALPFDTEYKLMATFHRMQDAGGHEVIRGYVKGAPDQLLRRSTTFLDAELKPAAIPRGADAPLPRREPATWRTGTARPLHRLSRFRTDELRPRSRPAGADARPDDAVDGGHRRPPAATGEGLDRDGQSGGHSCPDDHGGPCGHGAGHRHRARHRGPGDHWGRVLHHDRRPGRGGNRRDRRHRPCDPRGQGTAGRRAQTAG